MPTLRKKPSMRKKKRDLKREYRVTDSKPKAKKQRAAANRARRKLGLKVGDKRHAGHIKRGGGEGKNNIKPQNAKKNMAHGGRIGSKAGKAAGGRKGKRK